MFEAYTVAVTLKLNNLISPQLAEIAKDFEKLEGLSLSFRESIAKISTDAAGLKGLSSVMNSTNRAFERAAASAAAFQRELSGIRATGAGIPGMSGGGGGSGGRGSSGVHGGNIHLGPGGIGLGTAGFAAGDWFWPLAATGAAIYGSSSLFESAKELDTERQRFKLFGMTDAQNQEAFRYVDGMRVYGSTRAANMAAFREAQGVFRESALPGSAALEGAKLAAPVLAKLDFLAASLDDESAARMHTSNLNMLRYVESSGGLKSASEFNRIADWGYRLSVSSGGQVDWSQLRQLKARAGAAGFHLTDDALARLEPIIGELKGGAVGFGLSTAFNRLTGATRVPNQVAHELVDAGIWDPSKIIFNSQGGIKKMLGNPLSAANTELLATNFELFYEKVIRQMYEKNNSSTIDRARENVMILGRTGGANATLIENQLGIIQHSVEAVSKTLGIDAATDKAKGSLTGQQQEFEKAWTDFKADWGTSILPFFTTILTVGSQLLRPSGANTPWYVNMAKGSLNPIGSIFGAADSFISGQLQGRGNPVPATGGGTLHAVINMDGKKVANAIVPWLAAPMTGPQVGPSGFDPLQALPVTGGL